MSRRGYVLIEAQAGKVGNILTALRQRPGVEMADVVTGPYDLIAVIQGADAEAVAKMILMDIHGIEGVLRTMTCLAVEGGQA